MTSNWYIYNEDGDPVCEASSHTEALSVANYYTRQTHRLYTCGPVDCVHLEATAQPARQHNGAAQR